MKLSTGVADVTGNEWFSVPEEEFLIDFMRVWCRDVEESAVDRLYNERVLESLIQKGCLVRTERRGEFVYAPTMKSIKRAFQIYDRSPAYVGDGFVPGKMWAAYSRCNCKGK